MHSAIIHIPASSEPPRLNFTPGGIRLSFVIPTLFLLSLLFSPIHLPEKRERERPNFSAPPHHGRPAFQRQPGGSAARGPAT